MGFYWYPPRPTKRWLSAVPFTSGTAPYLFLNMSYNLRSLLSPVFIEDVVLQSFILLYIWGCHFREYKIGQEIQCSSILKLEVIETNNFKIQVYTTFYSKAFEIIVLLPKIQQPEHFIHTDRFSFSSIFECDRWRIQTQKAWLLPWGPSPSSGERKHVGELLSQTGNRKRLQARYDYAPKSFNAGQFNLHLKREGFPGGGSIFI